MAAPAGGGPTAFREETLAHARVAVRTCRAGAGDSVVFLHGAGGRPLWSAFFANLAAKFDLIVPEHPAFGASEDAQWLRNISDLSYYYLDFLEGLPGEKIHLIGHSLGGWIAAEAAIKNCSRIASLSLIAPAGVRIKGVPTGDVFIWSPEETVRNLYHDQSIADEVLKRVPTEEEADLRLRDRFAATRFGWEPRLFDPALQNWLHRVKVPTLVLWGAEDRIIPSRYAEVWQKQLPNVAVEIIPHCGHLPHIEKPDLVSQKIISFVENN